MTLDTIKHALQTKQGPDKSWLQNPLDAQSFVAVLLKRVCFPCIGFGARPNLKTKRAAQNPKTGQKAITLKNVLPRTTPNALNFCLAFHKLYYIGCQDRVKGSVFQLTLRRNQIDTMTIECHKAKSCGLRVSDINMGPQCAIESFSSDHQKSRPTFAFEPPFNPDGMPTNHGCAG